MWKEKGISQLTLQHSGDKPAVGPEVTLSTCQLDFLLPRRFDLSYIDNEGNKQTPVVIHRAILGTFDRFIT